MASIIKRKSKYSVVYRYIDENGKERQKWETFTTNAEAKKRKKEIEYKQENNVFSAPTSKTISDLMYDYVTIYGVNKWAISTYNSNKSLIDNYINPIIGNMNLDDCTPKIMEKYYLDLMKVKAIPRPYRRKEVEYVSAQTVKQVHKVLRSAFNQAVRWELLIRNPVDYATLPKVEKTQREAWDAPTLKRAFAACDDEILSLCIEMAFACSLRIGELLALTWDCVDLRQEMIDSERASIFIDKELQRVQRDGFEFLDGKDVKFKFPSYKPTGTTVLIIKTPKTTSSVRTIYLPKTLANKLLEYKANQDEIKDLLGSDYHDYDLVIANTDGRPIEGQIISRGLTKLIQENNLPKVVFHSLRHTSVTYKLKLSGGDIKAVQGDTGHAEADMVTGTYSHIVDEDRCINAQRLQRDFYEADVPYETIHIKSKSDKLSKREKLLALLDESPDMIDELFEKAVNM